jgi:stage V sporulation protein D (sporulation-specific penicillin-binding protein)
MVDEPQVAVDFGSVVAAPYVKMILEDTLNYLGVLNRSSMKIQSRKPEEVIVPDVTGKRLK